jgi:peptide/nickel transport system permease protein
VKEEQKSITYLEIRHTVQLVFSSPLGLLGAALVLLLLVMVVFAPLLATHDPLRTAVTQRLQAPSTTHWFGTDDLGRDVYSRIVYGSRYSMLTGVLVVLISLAIGSAVGLLGAYPGGRAGEWIMRVADVFLAFPTILAAISLSATLGASFFNALLSISIFYWAKYARLVYGQALSFKENEYVTYARVLRKGRVYIWCKHLYPNVFPVILVQVTLDFGDAILFFAALSFLGLGVQPPAPDWGAMISYGQRVITIAPWLSIFPGLFIFSTVLGTNLLGDALRDALDATMRQKQLKPLLSRWTWLGFLKKPGTRV